MTETLSYLDPSGDAPFHISFDVDGADAFFAGQTGTVFRDGLNHR
jgi:arginase family enzyme